MSTITNITQLQGVGSIGIVGTTPPIPPSTLLINFNGADGATTYTAETGQTVSFVGTAQLDDADKKFGATSLKLVSDGDYVNVPDNDNWNFGDGNFTIDYWVKPTSGYQMFTQWTDTNNRLICYTYDAGKIDCKFIVGGVVKGQIASAGVVLTYNQWQHCAYVRNGDRFDFYVNGVSVGNVTDSTTLPNLTGTFNIGANPQSAWESMIGWIDSFRITKGTALWTTDFSGSLPVEPTS